MQITYDPEKNRKNMAKHGIGFDKMELFDWESLQAEVDTRQNYGEVRYRGAGYIDKRLYVIAFTFREDIIRIISLRKANKRERSRYEKNR